MKDAEIMRVLADQAEEESYGSPVHQDRVFIIMWQSSRSGGTYTELRKSVRGKNRFLAGLNFLGVDLHEVQVFEQTKTWVPTPKTKEKKINDARTQSNIHSPRGQYTPSYSRRSQTGRNTSISGLH